MNVNKGKAQVIHDIFSVFYGLGRRSIYLRTLMMQWKSKHARPYCIILVAEETEGTNLLPK